LIRVQVKRSPTSGTTTAKYKVATCLLASKSLFDDSERPTILIL